VFDYISLVAGFSFVPWGDEMELVMMPCTHTHMHTFTRGRILID
jgi:hypothetical protein